MYIFFMKTLTDIITLFKWKLLLPGGDLMTNTIRVMGSYHEPKICSADRDFSTRTVKMCCGQKNIDTNRENALRTEKYQREA